MRRAGFTMIELVFVIVILGILSAVAVPKMMGVSDKAKAGVCGSYYSSLNGTVSPNLWANVAIDDADVNSSYSDANISLLITTPKGDKCGTITQIGDIARNADHSKDFTITIGKNSDGTDAKYDVNGTQATDSVAATWSWTKQK